MKVKIKQETKVFKPVTLELTFESKDELTLIKDMLDWDVSIPELTYPKDESTQLRLRRLMNELHAVVGEVSKDSE